MEPRKYDNRQQPLTTTLGTTLGAEAIPLETPTSDEARRAVREPVPGEQPYGERWARELHTYYKTNSVLGLIYAVPARR
ncbi:MAG: hypothetical protein M3R31_05585 [Pseudomonadota bacterium]|nr:hypothetical protein [Pseudomonadota bacterium]